MPVIKTDYRKWIEVMDMLMADEDYDDVRDRIAMIKNWVEHNEEITDGQIREIQKMQKERGDL